MNARSTKGDGRWMSRQLSASWAGFGGVGWGRAHSHLLRQHPCWLDLEMKLNHDGAAKWREGYNRGETG